MAPELLGCVLSGPNGSGRIVEVEAYAGSEDPASHAHRGPTSRSQTMFGPAGRLYVYLIYGLHHCANIVTGADGDGQAVLVRALEPVDGIEQMRVARPEPARDRDLTNGPGKLCEALGIDRLHDGVDLLDSDSTVKLRFPDVAENRPVGSSTRIGISVAVERPWRWYFRDSDWLSRPVPG